MQIDVKGRNVPVTDELRARIERRFRKVANQVPLSARLEIEIFEERNPAIAEAQVAEATLYMNGATLRAHESSRELGHSLILISEDIARQVKRLRDKRRRRREARGVPGASPAT